MKVTLQPGQQDSSTPNLGDLQFMLEQAMAEFRLADDASHVADRRLHAARRAVVELQEKIDAGIALLKSEAPTATKWADQRWDET